MFSDVGPEAALFFLIVVLGFYIAKFFLSLGIAFLIKKIIEKKVKKTMNIGQFLILAVVIMIALDFFRKIVKF